MANRNRKWTICSRCKGEGKSSAYLGTFTTEAMHDMGDEFMEAYVRGQFDRPCENCGGSGKVTQQDMDRNAQRRADLYLQWCESGRPEGSFSRASSP